MKKVFICSLCLSAALSPFAQTKMYVNMSDGTKVSYMIDKVESVTFGYDDIPDCQVDAENCDFTFEMTYNGIAVMGISDHIYPSKLELPCKVVIEGETYDVTTVEDDAFRGHNEIKEVVMPNSYTLVRNSSFQDCKNLQSITLSENLTGIMPFAFSGCTSLKYIEIPDGVREVGAYAFDSCTSLESFKLSASMSFLNSGTFTNCTSLEIVDLPETLLSIDESFKGCTGLKEFRMAKTATYIGARSFEGCTSLKYIFYPSTCTVEKGAYPSGVRAVVY